MSRNRFHPVTLTPTTLSLPYFAAVVAQHQSCADGISKGADLLVAIHQVEEGEDTLARRGIGGDGKDDARAACAHTIATKCTTLVHAIDPVAQNGLRSIPTISQEHLLSDFP